MNTNTYHLSPRRALSVFALLVTMFLSAIPMFAGSGGPDNLDVEGPDVSCIDTSGYGTDSALYISGFGTVQLAGMYWSDTYMTNDGSFYNSTFGLVGWFYELSSHMSSYQEVYFLIGALGANSTSFGTYIYGANSNGSVRSRLDTVSYAGASYDEEIRSMTYSW